MGLSLCAHPSEPSASLGQTVRTPLSLCAHPSEPSASLGPDRSYFLSLPTAVLFDPHPQFGFRDVFVCFSLTSRRPGRSLWFCCFVPTKHIRARLVFSPAQRGTVVHSAVAALHARPPAHSA